MESGCAGSDVVALLSEESAPSFGHRAAVLSRHFLSMS
jgi:hypothetical protein